MAEEQLISQGDAKSLKVGYSYLMRLFIRSRERMDQHATITDGVIALVLTSLALLHLRINWGLAESDVHPAIAVALVSLSVVPLTWRRRFPIAVLMVMTFSIILKAALQVPEGFSGNALLLALLSAAAYGGRWRTWVCGGSFAMVMGYTTYRVVLADLSDFEGDRFLLRIFSMFWNYFIFAAAWWFGDVIRTRRERSMKLEEQAIQLAREREENARRAVLDERVRIARELHDVVAHHVSVMGVQAGAARRVLEKQPEKAREVLSLIETSSRQAVAELHRLLGFLRGGPNTDTLAPQPSMKGLGILAGEMQEAGLPVEVKIEGKERPLPRGIDLSAYRIVQEALTNTLKHAGPAKATVTINYANDVLNLEILDSGRSATETDMKEPKGRGIVGMRERVSLLGGEFYAGMVPGVGFSVRARIPLHGQFS